MTDLRDIKSGIFLIDSIAGRFKRYQNTLRFLRKMDRQKQSPIVVVYFSIQLLEYFNPFILKNLKKGGSKSLCILTDGAWSRNKLITQTYSTCFDFISCWDDPFFPEIGKSRVIQKRFSPFPKSIEHPPSFVRPVDVSFIGKIDNRPDREKIVDYIREAPFKSAIFTEREGFLSIKEYYRIAQNSKIIINNSQSGKNNETINQLKGRVFEAMLSGNLLLENKNNLTSSIFTPGVHYVEYDNVTDLITLLNYHIKNFDHVGYKIALNGHLRACQFFSGSEYWRYVLEEIEDAEKI